MIPENKNKKKKKKEKVNVERISRDVGHVLYHSLLDILIVMEISLCEMQIRGTRRGP